MTFLTGILVGLMIGITLMCLLSIIDDEDEEFEIDVEENKE